MKANYATYGFFIILLMVIMVLIIFYSFGWGVGNGSDDYYSESEIDQIIKEAFDDL